MLRRSLKQIKVQKVRRAGRVRAKVSGSAACPRISVFRSLKHLSVQAIDDFTGKTLATASDREFKAKPGVDSAQELGKGLAAKLQKLNITRAVFDKGRYAYHGQVKAVAEGLRAGGLTL